MRRFYHTRYLAVLLLLIITFRAQSQEKEPLFPQIDEVLYQDQAHAYDDPAVIVLSRKKIPTITSRLIPVRKGDIMELGSYVHYTRDGSNSWQKVGTIAAGLAIGSLPYLIDQNTNSEGVIDNSLLKRVAPVAGAGVASIPFILDKRHRQSVRRRANGFVPKNGWFVPDAYLKYTLFDDQGVLLTSEYQALDKTAKDSWQKLSLTAEATQNGYMTVEIGNQSKRPVWFDQLETVHRSRVDASNRLGFEGLPIGGDSLQTNSRREYRCYLIYGSVGGVVISSYIECDYYDEYDPSPPGPPTDNRGDDPFEECTMQFGDEDYCDCVVNGNCSDGQDPNDPPGGFGGSSGGSGTGAFDVTSLSSSQREEFQNVVETMSENCFYKAMVKHLYLNPKVKTNSSQPSPGGYSGISNTITFKSTNNINLPTAAAEIFHAYQQQHTNKLDNIQRDPNGVGRPNIEFEEKFMALVAGYIEIERNYPPNFLPSLDFPGMTGVGDWVSSIVDANGGTFPSSFTVTQQNQYSTFLRAFQSYHANPFNESAEPKYGTPLDTAPGRMTPSTTFEILKKSDC